MRGRCGGRGLPRSLAGLADLRVRGLFGCRGAPFDVFGAIMPFRCPLGGSFCVSGCHFEVNLEPDSEPNLEHDLSALVVALFIPLNRNPKLNKTKRR